MFRLMVIAAIVAAAASSPVIQPFISPYGAYHAPVVKAALPVATSYANTYRVASPLIAPAALTAPAPVFSAPAPVFPGTSPVFAPQLFQQSFAPAAIAAPAIAAPAIYPSFG